MTDSPNKPDLRGAEFVPPIDRPLATPREIADFCIARGLPGWSAAGKGDYVKQQQTLAARNPDKYVRDMSAQTNHVRKIIYGEQAKGITTQDIVQRFEKLGFAEPVKEYGRQLRRLQPNGSEKEIEALRLKTAVALLEQEDKQRAKSGPVAAISSPEKSAPGQQKQEPGRSPESVGREPSQIARVEEKQSLGNGARRGAYNDLKKEQADIPFKPSFPGGR